MVFVGGRDQVMGGGMGRGILWWMLLMLLVRCYN